jgi:Berberine and berberine like
MPEALNVSVVVTPDAVALHGVYAGGADDAWPALAPHVTGGSFLNFLNDPSRTRDAYTAADFARLLEVKRAYDPDNMFGVGHSLVPASAGVNLAA